MLEERDLEPVYVVHQKVVVPTNCGRRVFALSYFGNIFLLG